VLSGVHTQAVATVGPAPLSMMFFQQVSLAGFVANLVAIPLVTVVITPLALLGIVWRTLWLALCWLTTRHLECRRRTSRATACGLLGGLLLVMPLLLRLRLLGVPLLLPLLLPPVERPAAGEFEVVVADIRPGHCRAAAPV
jgi:competence protein ComEC